jgi:RPA family protein
MNQEKDSSPRSSFARKAAKKLHVSDIHNSTYIKRPGWEPSGVITRYGEISRVYVMGIIVSIEDNTFLLDDGSGNISIRFFETQDMSKYALGDLMIVIGRPREWESSKYIVPEIVRKVDDKRWYELHQLELKLQGAFSVKLPVEQESQEVVETGPYQKILNVIAILDKGHGADIDDIITHVKVTGCEKIINSLLEEGEIFEISPGKVKLLE